MHTHNPGTGFSAAVGNWVGWRAGSHSAQNRRVAYFPQEFQMPRPSQNQAGTGHSSVQTYTSRLLGRALGAGQPQAQLYFAHLRRIAPAAARKPLTVSSRELGSGVEPDAVPKPVTRPYP